MLKLLDRNRHALNRNSIKESLDHLPTGICFFYEDGILVLCNYQMHRLMFELTGKDLQSLSELRQMLAEKHIDNSMIREGYVVLLADDSAWYFNEEEIIDQYNQKYIQITASDISDLRLQKQRLAEENEQLIKVQDSLRILAGNVVAETREKEILSMKMRVHDDIGSSMVAAHQLLNHNQNAIDIDSIASVWQKAIDLLKRSSEEEPETDQLSSLRKLSAGMGIEIELQGEMPASEAAGYLLITAMKECITNAVRYGQASHLYVRIIHTGNVIEARIANDGRPPQKTVREGGGLSMLRSRITAAGGTMKIISRPAFELTVRIPEEGNR